MQAAFEIEAGVINSKIKPVSADILYWLNRAIEKFVKTRYTGNNPKGEAFELNQKRTDDLRTLVKEVTLTVGAGTLKPSSFIATLPTDYMYSVGEEALIQFTDPVDGATSKRVGVNQITIDRYSTEIDNPLGEYNLHYRTAKPLRLQYGSVIELVTDGNYTVVQLFLRYLKTPVVVSLPSTSCDLPAVVHPEIVKMAVSMYIENIKGDRYQTIEHEVTEME